MGIPTKSLLFEHLADFLSVEDYLKLGQVSKGLRKTVKPLIELRRHCNVVSVAPNLEITSLISPRCDHHLRRILSKKTDIPFPIKSVTLHDWRYANLANVLVLDKPMNEFYDPYYDSGSIASTADLDRLEFRHQKFRHWSGDFSSNLERLFLSIERRKVKELQFIACEFEPNDVPFLENRPTHVSNFRDFIFCKPDLEKIVFKDLAISFTDFEMIMGALVDLPFLKVLQLENFIFHANQNLISIISKNQLEELVLVSTTGFSTVISEPDFGAPPERTTLEETLSLAVNLKRLKIYSSDIRCHYLGRSLKKLTKLESFSFLSKSTDDLLPADWGLVLNSLKSLSNLKHIAITSPFEEYIPLYHLENLESLEVYSIRNSNMLESILRDLKNRKTPISRLTLCTFEPEQNGDIRNIRHIRISQNSRKLLREISSSLKYLKLEGFTSRNLITSISFETLERLSFLGYDEIFLTDQFQEAADLTRKAKNLKYLSLGIIGGSSDVNPNIFRGSKSIQTLILQGIKYKRRYVSGKFKDSLEREGIRNEDFATLNSVKKGAEVAWTVMLMFLVFSNACIIINMLNGDTWDVCGMESSFELDDEFDSD